MQPKKRNCIQNKGLAMGSPISAMLSEIFLQKYEDDHVSKIWNNHKIKMWVRYVDDIFIIYDETYKDEHDIILNKLNNFHKNIQYTCELENDRRINFLDIDIRIIDNKIQTSVFRKHFANNITINNFSNHPMSQKYGTYYNMINRAHIYTNNNLQLFEEEIKYIKEIAVKNEYESGMVEKILKKYMLKINYKDLTTLQPTANNKNKKYLTYKYTNKKLELINKKIYKNYKEDVNIAYKPNSKLIKYFNNDRSHMQDKKI